MLPLKTTHWRCNWAGGNVYIYSYIDRFKIVSLYSRYVHFNMSQICYIVTVIISCRYAYVLLNWRHLILIANSSWLERLSPSWGIQTIQTIAWLYRPLFRDSEPCATNGAGFLKNLARKSIFKQYIFHEADFLYSHLVCMCFDHEKTATFYQWSNNTFPWVPVP